MPPGAVITIAMIYFFLQFCGFSGTLLIFLIGLPIKAYSGSRERFMIAVNKVGKLKRNYLLILKCY